MFILEFLWNCFLIVLTLIAYTALVVSIVKVAEDFKNDW